MEILKWTIVGLLAISSISIIAMIDQPRKPITRSVAIIDTIINVGLIFWLLKVF